MFRLPPDPGNPDAQAKGLAPQRASAAPSRGAGSFFGPKQPVPEPAVLTLTGHRLRDASQHWEVSLASILWTCRGQSRPKNATLEPDCERPLQIGPPLPGSPKYRYHPPPVRASFGGILAKIS
jgi:hypothetical protein